MLLRKFERGKQRGVLQWKLLRLLPGRKFSFVELVGWRKRAHNAGTGTLAFWRVWGKSYVIGSWGGRVWRGIAGGVLLEGKRTSVGSVVVRLLEEGGLGGEGEEFLGWVLWVVEWVGGDVASVWQFGEFVGWSEVRAR